MKVYKILPQYENSNLRELVDYYEEEYCCEPDLWNAVSQFCQQRRKSMDEFDGMDFFWGYSDKELIEGETTTEHGEFDEVFRFDDGLTFFKR